MRVATFNINNVNKRLGNLLEWLEAEQPDAVALQELKSTDAAFPAEAIGALGYGAVWKGERNWNGVAILARGTDPVLTRRNLPGDPHDAQSRYLEAAVNGLLVAAIYLPNGNPQPGPKFDYKLAWLARLRAHARALWDAAVPAVLAGDFNVVPTDADIYPSRSWGKDALLQPQSRAGYAELLAQGWLDAVRALHPAEPMYSFWDYKRDRWSRDAGLRIDHLLLSAPLHSRLRAAGVDRWVRGRDNASDHAPVWVELDWP
jgi:exodeoxyribonuclease-3